MVFYILNAFILVFLSEPERRSSDNTVIINDSEDGEPFRDLIVWFHLGWRRMKLVFRRETFDIAVAVGSMARSGSLKGAGWGLGVGGWGGLCVVTCDPRTSCGSPVAKER
jgi:hypothetical protein